MKPFGWCALVVLMPVLSPFISAGGDFASGSAGTAGSEFLSVDAGARGIAMAGAYTAVSQDATSLYWNPAGLALIPRLSAGYMHNRYVAGIQFNYLAYAQRLTETAVLGAALRHLDAGAIEATDINGNAQGDIHPRSFVYELGYGQYITDLSDFERDVSMGISARYFHSDLVAHAGGAAADIGLQSFHHNAYIPYRFGAVVQNLGRGQKFDKTRDHLPFRARFGASAQLARTLLLALDAVLPVSQPPYAALGGEASLEAGPALKGFFRAGFETQSLTSGLDGFRGLRLGLGLAAGDVAFDYAFVPMGILGDTHRFSISLNLRSKSSRRYREK